MKSKNISFVILNIDDLTYEDGDGEFVNNIEEAKIYKTEKEVFDEIEFFDDDWKDRVVVYKVEINYELSKVTKKL